jgi:putative transposase
LRPIGRAYPSDLSDKHWKLIQQFIPKARTGGRPRTTDVREVFNAILYVTRSGCAWRYLPGEFPPWQTVYRYYSRWKALGVLKKIHDFLVGEVRELAHRNRAPSTLIVDCQSAKAGFGEERGYDGYKKVRGRKRTIFVDTLGLIHSVQVSTAQRGDYVPALQMLQPGNPHFPATAAKRLSAFYADAGYRAHDFQNAVYRNFKVWPTLTVSQSEEVCERQEDRTYRFRRRVRRSNLKPVRWRVERTFAWFNFYRRLARDYERNPSSSEAMIQMAMTRLMLNRLQRPKKAYVRWH